MTQLREGEDIYNAMEVLADDIALIATATTAMNEMNRDMYGNVAYYIHNNIHDITGLDARLGVAKDALERLELRIKDRHDVTSLPNSYRSSKSVLLKAVAIGIYIYDENGKLQPKSVLEKQVKDHMTAMDALLAASQIGLMNSKMDAAPTDFEKMKGHLLEAHKLCVDNNWHTVALDIEVILKSLGGDG